jgi:hypothetical protein
VTDLGEHLRAAAHLATEIDPSEGRRALAEVAALALLLASRAAEERPEVSPLSPVSMEAAREPVWLNAEQVQALYGLTPGFLAGHRAELAQLGAVSKIGHRTYVYRASKIRSFIQNRSVDPGRTAG